MMIAFTKRSKSTYARVEYYYILLFVEKRSLLVSHTAGPGLLTPRAGISLKLNAFIGYTSVYAPTLSTSL